MSQIISEIPSGLINWINTIFNTSQTWTNIISVFKDWAEISNSNYTYVWTVLTFTTSPLFSVSIIYSVWTWFALSDWELLIPNSALFWTIDWVNKTFSVSTWWIKQVLSCVYDWAETRDFSFVPWSQTITFTFAPTEATSPIYLDYITYWSNLSDNSFPNNSTQLELINRIYNDILHEKTTSTVFSLQTTKLIVSEIQDAICTGWYTDMNWQTYKSPNLTFLNKKSFYKLYDDTTSASIVNIWWTQISCVNSYPSTWTLLINWNILAYNWNDWSIISWIIWLNTSINVWDKIKLVYALPNDIYKWFNVKKHIWWIETVLNEIDSRDNLWNIGYFITEDHYDNKYVWFNWIGWKDVNIEFNYIRKSPDVSASTNIILPKPFWITILPNLVCARLLINWDENTKAKNLEVLGVNELKRLYENYASKIKEFKWRIEWNNDNFLINN